MAALVRRLVSPKPDEGGSQTKAGLSRRNEVKTDDPGLIDGITSGLPEHNSFRYSHIIHQIHEEIEEHQNSYTHTDEALN